MSDEKNNFEKDENEEIKEIEEIEEIEESEEESSEDIAENTEKEPVEDITENSGDNTEDITENSGDNTDESAASEDDNSNTYTSENSIDIADSNTELTAADSKRKNIIAASTAAAVIIVLVVIAVLYNMDVFETNKYNKMGYVNISGRSLSDIADAAGVTLEELKQRYELPEDMPGDTDEAAAFYNMPARKIAEMYGMDFAEIKESLQLPDTITETTPWGEAEGEALLKNYVGEDSIDSFKEEYGFGDDVTGDTKWKDIRNTVDKAMLEERKKQEKELAKATTQPDTSAEGTNELSEEELQALIDQAMNSADGTASTSNDTTPVPADNAQTPADNQ